MDRADMHTFLLVVPASAHTKKRPGNGLGRMQDRGLGGCGIRSTGSRFTRSMLGFGHVPAFSAPDTPTAAVDSGAGGTTGPPTSKKV